ncbi:MAG: glycosyltransferase family 39 protein [Oligoflexia bacterium]|nr:glycosyltransferase family 39 protein [Oligoflexia bacterium]
MNLGPALGATLFAVLLLYGGELFFDDLVARPAAELHGRLPRLTVLFLDLALLTTAIGACLSWSALRRAFTGISPRQRAWLAAAVLLPALLAGTHAPRTNRIYYDEHIYQGIAQYISFKGEALLCSECDLRYDHYKPVSAEYNKQPQGYPYYLSLFYSALGAREWVAHLANVVALALGGLAVYGITFLLFQSAEAALLSALLYGFTPINLVWSNTAASEPSSAAFAALAFLATLLFAGAPGFRTGLLSLGTVALAFQFRPESLLLGLPLGALLWFGPRPVKPRWLLALWSAALVLLLVPHLAHLYLFSGHDWGAASADARFSLKAFSANLPVNGPFYLDNRNHPLLFTLLAVSGLFSLARWRAVLPVALWWLCLWGIFLFFYAGSYQYGADIRYALLSFAPLAILGGWGGYRLLAILGSRLGPATAVLALGATLAVSWHRFGPLVRATGEEAFDARNDVEAAREFAQLLPKDAIVLGHNPSMWNLWGKSALQASIVAAVPVHQARRLESLYPDGLYFHWNFWCNVPDPVQAALCADLLSQFRTETVKEKYSHGKRYALIRLIGPLPGRPSRGR